MQTTENTYFCACMGSRCNCADNLDRDILATLEECDMSAFDLAESCGVSVPMVRDALKSLIEQGRVKRGERITYTIV